MWNIGHIDSYVDNNIIDVVVYIYIAGNSCFHNHSFGVVVYIHTGESNVKGGDTCT